MMAKGKVHVSTFEEHVMPDAIQIVTMSSDLADAERIATVLVANRLAACVQLSGPVESTYRWKDQIETSSEWCCTIKTLRALYPQVESKIRELHSYGEPEIVATAIVAASESYLDWIAKSVGPSSSPPDPPSVQSVHESGE
jgi:periplasmic divalent cation tolerance protein